MKYIKMLKKEKGSPDGVSIETYQSGKCYWVSEGLCKAFVEQLKCAELVLGGKKATAPPSNKMAKVPENKEPEKETEKEKAVDIKEPEKKEEPKQYNNSGYRRRK